MRINELLAPEQITLGGKKRMLELIERERKTWAILMETISLLMGCC